MRLPAIHPDNLARHGLDLPGLCVIHQVSWHAIDRDVITNLQHLMIISPIEPSYSPSAPRGAFKKLTKGDNVQHSAILSGGSVGDGR